MHAAPEPQRHAPQPATARETRAVDAAKTLPTPPNCYERMETVEHAEATVRSSQTPPICERTP